MGIPYRAPQLFFRRIQVFPDPELNLRRILLISAPEILKCASNFWTFPRKFGLPRIFGRWPKYRGILEFLADDQKFEGIKISKNNPKFSRESKLVDFILIGVNKRWSVWYFLLKGINLNIKSVTQNFFSLIRSIFHTWIQKNRKRYFCAEVTHIRKLL